MRVKAYKNITSTRSVGLDCFCNCSPEESLALWPVWASYSQAKMCGARVHTHAHTVQICRHRHTQKACVHRVRNRKYAEGAWGSDWLCVSLTTSVTKGSCHKALMEGPWPFLFLVSFSHIFLMSHTFVDNSRSNEYFKLPTVRCWWFFFFLR